MFTQESGLRTVPRGRKAFLKAKQEIMFALSLLTQLGLE